MSSSPLINILQVVSGNMLCSRKSITCLFHAMLLLQITFSLMLHRRPPKAGPIARAREAILCPSPFTAPKASSKTLLLIIIIVLMM